MTTPNDRAEILLGGPNESDMGLARAVRVGSHISVGGTAAINEDGSNVGSDMTEQTERVYEIIGQALAQAGASVGDVVRTRTMLTDMSDYRSALAVRKRWLGESRATETIVQVVAFVDPAWRIEVEVDAILPDATRA